MVQNAIPCFIVFEPEFYNYGLFQITKEGKVNVLFLRPDRVDGSVTSVLPVPPCERTDLCR